MRSASGPSGTFSTVVDVIPNVESTSSRPSSCVFVQPPSDGTPIYTNATLGSFSSVDALVFCVCPAVSVDSVVALLHPLLLLVNMHLKRVRTQVTGSLITISSYNLSPSSKMYFYC